MKRTLICTVEVDLEEMPDAERAAAAKLEECEPDALPSLADIPPRAAMGTESTLARDYKDFAIEFGEYLAQAASRYLANTSAQIIGPDGHADYRALRSAIYEFRKRAARAQA